MQLIYRNLSIEIGPAALAQLRREGLQADGVSAIVGAAGGPKGLGLAAMDRWLFGEFLPQRRRPEPVHLIGSSVGAVRMLAGAHDDPLAAIDRFVEAYTAQSFAPNPSPADITSMFRDFLIYLIGERSAEVLGSTRTTLSLLASRVRDGRDPTGWDYAKTAAANALGRQHTARYFARTVFETQSVLADPGDRFGLQRVPLHAGNLFDAALASGTLPAVMTPVRDIADADGVYVDGGIVDYHPVLPFAQLPGIVLYPHFGPDLLPGWFDKWFSARRTGPARSATGWLDNVILIAPAPALLARLPGGKLPDRKDFTRYGQDHAGRQAAWQRGLAELAVLGDDLARWVRDLPGSLAV